MVEYPYFSKPGQSSGNLARFWNNGEHCPDAVLVPMEWKYDFARGHAFEAVVMDFATGKRTFFEDFYISEIENEPPDDVAKCVKYGNELDDLIVLTAKGERNKTYSKRHAYIDECKKFPGLMPVCQTDYSSMRELAKSICDLDFPEWHPLGRYKIGDYLAGCQWQTEHCWADNGIEKKALADCLYTQHGAGFPADIKWTSSFSQFKSAFQAHHWIQAVHYERGISASLGVKCSPMLFLVGCVGAKNEPNLAQVWSVDKKQRDDLIREYDRLCMEYDDWEKAGKPKSGKLKERVQRIWI
jgi:hypothetical protein